MVDPTDVTTKIGREAAAKAKAFIETNETAKKATDAFYTLVGLGVIGAQKITVDAKSTQEKIDSNVGESSESVKKSLKDTVNLVDAKVDQALKAIDSLTAPYQEKLPEATRAAVQKAREATDSLRAHLKERISSHDDETKSES